MRERILSYLEKNSRLTAKDIAELIGADEQEVRAEIAAMEADKVICGYHTLINWDKISDNRVTALIEVRVTPQRGQGCVAIAERIYRFDEVKSVYLMSGAYDLLLLVEAHTLKELAFFVSTKLSTLETVTGTATHFVLKRYKSDGVIFEGNDGDKRLVVTA